MRNSLLPAAARDVRPCPAVGDPPAANGHAAHRVMRFILAHLDEPLSIDRIAKAASLSVRTLHRVVMREFGVSPMALLRLTRLSMASAELRAPATETTVTGVALRWGFTHLGRFARDYARQFGESPSDALRRGRRLSSEGPRTGWPVEPPAWRREREWPTVGGAA